MLAVFDTHSPPDVRLFCGKRQVGLQRQTEPFGSLGENLIRVPVRRNHYLCYGGDVIFAYSIMKEITHGVYEDHSGCTPAQGLTQLFWE